MAAILDLTGKNGLVVGIANEQSIAYTCIIAGIVGAILGAFLSDRLRKLRWLLFMIAIGFFCVGLLCFTVALYVFLT